MFKLLSIEKLMSRTWIRDLEFQRMSVWIWASFKIKMHKFAQLKQIPRQMDWGLESAIQNLIVVQIQLLQVGGLGFRK